jgi:hypothetical protein
MNNMGSQVAWDSSKQDYVNVKEEKEESFMMRQTRDYADVSSIVGLRFCTEKPRPLHEK